MPAAVSSSHLVQQCIIQALHQVRVRHVSSQELALFYAEVLQGGRAQPTGCQLLLGISKINVDSVSPLLGAVPA
jgi:hypothetical protein